jgi:hypothetical protein
MLKNLTTVAVSLLGMAATSAATLPTPSFASTSNLQKNLTEVIKIQETATKEVAPEEKPKEKRLTCVGCNSYELTVLNALQDEGVVDKVAIATIMGNIKQESTFIPNICETSGIVPYHRCRSGGFGILQWTDSARYNGLGNFAKKYGGDPSSIHTQIKYMFYEPDWHMIKEHMKKPGGTINDYMRLAYRWVRWGHKGPRETYARQYLNKFSYEVADSR